MSVSSMFGDPQISAACGVDSGGVPRRLGERDSDGVTVGFIDPSGTCWESWEEKVIALAAGRYGEAFCAWSRTGGLVGQMPTPADFVDDTVSGELFARVAEHCLLETQIRMIAMLERRAHAAGN